jgi:hypothetical protein
MAETKENLVTALARVQGSLPSIKKDAKGNYGKYVTLDAIHEAVLPLLSANELAWVTMPTYDDNGEPILEYKLMHSGGEKLEGKMRMYVSQANSQQQGSAITYAKRYAICAVVGVTADDDDDGEAAKGAPAKTYPRKAAQPTIDPTKSPEGPARQVNDEQISAISKERVRQAIKTDQRFVSNDEVMQFIRNTIGKDAPTTEQDATKLIDALNNDVPFL